MKDSEKLMYYAEGSRIFPGCWELVERPHETCDSICESMSDSWGCDGCPIDKVFQRLAEYEETGLSPAEITELKKRAYSQDQGDRNEC